MAKWFWGVVIILIFPIIILGSKSQMKNKTRDIYDISPMYFSAIVMYIIAILIVVSMFFD